MDNDIYLQIVEDLLVDTTSSGKMFSTLQELMDVVPPLGIASVKKKFNFFFGDKHGKVFEEGDKIVLFPYVYMSIINSGPKYEDALEPSGEPFSDHYNGYTGESLDNKSILIWRNGGIGDIIFIQPILRYLKIKYPTCKIYFACSPAYFTFLKTWGDLIDELFATPFSLETFKMADYHVTFEGVIERCKEAESVNAYKLFSRKMGLDIPDSILRPSLNTIKSSNDTVEKFLFDNDIEKGNYICTQFRSSSPVRTPPLDVWARLFIPLLKQGHKIVVADTPDLHEQLDTMIGVIIPAELRHNFYNFSKYSKSINDSISLMNYSKLVLAPDSSFVHIAAGLSVPVIGLYAPFDAEVRMSTYQKCDWIQPEQDDNRICEYGGRRCFLHGNKCPVNINMASPCFYNIDFAKAQEKIQNILENTNG